MKQITKRFALCIDNTDYEVSLIRSKVYRILPDSRAAKDDFFAPRIKAGCLSWIMKCSH